MAPPSKKVSSCEVIKIQPHKVTYLCFDIGNVLWKLAWREAFESIFQLPFEPFAPVFQEFSQSQAHWDYEMGISDEKTFFKELQRSFQRHKIHPELATVSQFWQEGLGQPYPWVAKSLEQLARHFRLVALSNTNPFHFELFSRQEEFAPFEKIFASHHLRLRKPDPAIYQTVTEELGVLPENMFFMDDLGENVASAKALGWQTWHCTDSQKMFEELPKLLKLKLDRL